MSKIKVLADGSSKQDIASKKGKLFEDLMSFVLKNSGISIENVQSRNYAGMEIDIEGKTITNTPIYAECKCYDKEIDSPKFQAFFGKYSALWFNNPKAEGLFFAIPSVNSHARAFYEDNCQKNSQITLKLFSEEDIVNSVISSGLYADPKTIAMKIPDNIGYSKEWEFLYTERGGFWLFYIIFKGETIPKYISIFDEKGNAINNDEYSYFSRIDKSLDVYNYIDLTSSNPDIKINTVQRNEIIELKGSSSSFEYHFPAAPEYFRGRKDVIAEIEELKKEILNETTSKRGILFQANSGFGKSSLVLYLNNELENQEHFSMAIDCRTVSSSNFIIEVIEYLLMRLRQKFPAIINSIEECNEITGEKGALEAILKVGATFKENNILLFIFLDQFENVFYQQEALRKIRDFYFKIIDAQSNIIMGFSWKTDLFGKTTDFPYQIRDDIVEKSLVCSLEAFNQLEINQILDLLEIDITKKLSGELRFCLSDFSQGYPWLLKKLCNHVKEQLNKGLSQTQISNKLLNAEELFKEDLNGLTPEEQNVLKYISKNAPISIAEIDEKIDCKILQSLVNRRLIVSVGSKYDIYWDIFRDYLNIGKIPVQETYYLQIEPSRVSHIISLIYNENITSFEKLKEVLKLAEKSFNNVVKDLKVLDLINPNNSGFNLNKSIGNIKSGQALEDTLREYLKEKLLKNRLYNEIYKNLELNNSLTIEELSAQLPKLTPFISANSETWQAYARRMASWMSFARLVIYNTGTKSISYFDSSKQLPESFVIKNKSFNIPIIQFGPVERVLLEIYNSTLFKRFINRKGFSKSTFNKSLNILESLDFIEVNKKTRTLKLKINGVIFARDESARPKILAEVIKNNIAFMELLKILNINNAKFSRLTQENMAKELRKNLGVNWSIGTARVNVKIMLDWLRYANLAPNVYKSSRINTRGEVGVNAGTNRQIMNQD